MRTRTRAAGVLLSLIGLTAIGTTSAVASTVPDDAGAPWTFVDDMGTTVETPERPERIVMFEDVAASLMDFGVRPVGIHYIQDDGNTLFDGLDLDGIESVGANCETINVEAVAALEPDLIVYMNWGETDDAAFCLESNQRRQLEEFAPVLQMRAEGSADEILARYAELAEALGADLESADVVAKREGYEAASERLATAIAERPEISIIPLSVSPDYFGIAEPTGFADLVTLQDRYGVEFVGPFDPDEFTATYWQEYSAELATTFRGDVILMDAKNATPLDAKLDAFPLWAALPEVAAGQIVPWFVPGSFSYTRDAAFMDSLAGAIETAEDFVPEE